MRLLGMPLVQIFLAAGLVWSCQTKEANNSTDQVDSNLLFTAPIGVQAYSFRNYFPKDIPGTLDKIAALGITEIESGSGKLPPEEYKKLCDARGINLVSTGASFEDLKEDPEGVLATAKALGASYVMCAWVPHDKGQFSKENADHAIDVFTKAGKILNAGGVTFCYHAHGYEFQPYQDATLMEYMIENSDPQFVAFEMDIFWIQFGGGDPAALLLKYPDRWKLMHLKDMKKGIPKDLTGGTDVENDVPLGTGQIDLVAVLKAAQEIGIAHYFIEDESSSVWDQVPESITYLKTVKK